MNIRKSSARIAFSAAVGILVLALVPAAFAGKGGKSSTRDSSSSLTLQLVNDVTGNGQPDWGDTVRFLVTNAPSEPNVELLCSQGGTVVYSAQTGYFQNTWPSTSDMVLSSQAWSGGPASCTARLFVFSGSTTTTLATSSFAAGG